MAARCSALEPHSVILLQPCLRQAGAWDCGHVTDQDSHYFHFKRFPSVSRGGRFGKYGEAKRLARLRQSGCRPSLPERVGPRQRHRTPFSTLKGNTTIRPAKQSDKDFLTRLSGEVFSIYGPYKGTISRWFESDATLTLLSTAGNKPVGFVMIAALPGDTEGETRVEVLAIAVAPGFQRRGIGKELLQCAEKKAEEWGEHSFFLHTARENLAARRLFSRNGYRPVAIKKSFYPSGLDAFMMVKELGKDLHPLP